MKKLILTALCLLAMVMPSQAADGVVNVQSLFKVKETADRMESILKVRGMTVFNRIKHSSGARQVGIELRDTELIIFGNPRVGSPLMKCQQSVAIDLPQKVLIWEDDQSTVWISYNDPRYLEKRHHLVGCEAVLLKIEKVLAGMVKLASRR